MFTKHCLSQTLAASYNRADTYHGSLLEAFLVGAVNDVNLQCGPHLDAVPNCAKGYTHENIGVFEVVAPIRPNLSLTTNIPHVQFEARGLNTFYVETLRDISEIFQDVAL